MGGRRTARERALQALYQLDISPGASTAEALDSAWAAGAGDGTDSGSTDGRDDETTAFAKELVEGVRAHLMEIDQLIERHSHNWRLDRMSRIDRNVLRLGIYELKFLGDIPKKVTLNEAVELGKTFGSEESSSFINGLLDRVAVALDKP